MQLVVLRAWLVLLNALDKLHRTDLAERLSTFGRDFNAALEFITLMECVSAFRAFLSKRVDALFNALAIFARSTVCLDLKAALDVFEFIILLETFLFRAHFLELLDVLFLALLEGSSAILSGCSTEPLDFNPAIERLILEDLVVARFVKLKPVPANALFDIVPGHSTAQSPNRVATCKVLSIGISAVSYTHLTLPTKRIV